MFDEYDLDANLRNFLVNIRKEIESDRSILDADEEEYRKGKIDKHKIIPLNVFPEKINVSQKEHPIPARFFPSPMYDVEHGKSYPKPVLTFRIPFEGDPQWLRCRPSAFLYWSEEIDIEDGNIIFEIINFDNNVERVKSVRDGFIKNLQTQIGNINQNISNYNGQLEGVVVNAMNKAKEKFKAQDNFLSELGNAE